MKRLGRFRIKKTQFRGQELTRIYKAGYLQSFQNLEQADRPTYFMTEKAGIEGGEPIVNGWLGTVNETAFYGHGLVVLMEIGRAYYFFERVETALARSVDPGNDGEAAVLLPGQMKD